jgi:hypothetical protein
MGDGKNMNTNMDKFTPGRGLGTQTLARLLASALLLTATLFTSTANAIPVTYTEGVYSGSGALGDYVFNQAYVVFDFQSDTSSVSSYSVPGADGYINSTGVATVSIYDIPTSSFITATFLPDQLFVSVDSTNGGIGFGSFSSGAYDPLYPFAIFTPEPTYDLKSDYTIIKTPGMSCSGFGAGPECINKSTIVPLMTDLGVFYMTWEGIVGASFATRTTPDASVPEPSTLALMPLGLGMLAFIRRNRRQQSAKRSV